ncbi:MAG: GlsB/YeaQ/YmgE family stress response membrane protein [Kofleriaceae bacterium]
MRAPVSVMTLEMIVIWALVGLVSGWLASQVVRGGGSGVVADIVIGIVGAFIGGFVFRSAGWHAPFDGYAGLIFVAFCGAALLLIVMRLVYRGRSRRA